MSINFGSKVQGQQPYGTAKPSRIIPSLLATHPKASADSVTIRFGNGHEEEISEEEQASLLDAAVAEGKEKLKETRAATTAADTTVTINPPKKYL